MVAIGWIIAIGVIVMVIGAGIGYAIWLFTRPKKLTWDADIFTISDATKKRKYAEGINLKLKDLRPYMTDVLEKIYPDGYEVYNLQKLGKTTSQPTADTTVIFPNQRPKVRILLHGGKALLLRTSYDERAGEEVVDPVPYETMNMAQHEMATRKARIKEKKDILQSITPWVITFICVAFVFATIYALINGAVTISANQKDQTDILAKKDIEIAKLQREGMVAIALAIDSADGQIDKELQEKIKGLSGPPSIQ